MAGNRLDGITLLELSSRLGAPLNPAGKQASSLIIRGLGTLANAQPDQLSFLSNPKYTAQLAASAAGAFILPPLMAADEGRPCLMSDNPYLTYAHASQLFALLEGVNLVASGYVDPTASVSPQAQIGHDVVIGPHVSVEAGAVIGDRCRLGANVVIGRGAVIGQDSVLHANSTIYHKCVLGERVIVHSAAVIGADGFGFAFDGQQSVKIAQLGSVVIGRDVEIGAGTTIDRGALDDTVIGNGVKIDNQVQIGHNCVVGDHTVICGCTALAGSTRIGRYCLIGGGVGITGHLSICDKVSVTAMSMVTRSIEKPGVYSSGSLLQESSQWRRNAVLVNSLSDMNKKLRNLEKRLPE